MAELQKANKKAKLNFFTKICIFVVFVLLFVIVVQMNMRINDRKVVLQKMQEEFAQRQLSIEQIKSDIAKLPDNVEDLDEETIKKIASQELNLCDNNVIIFANSQPN